MQRYFTCQKCNADVPTDDDCVEVRRYGRVYNVIFTCPKGHVNDWDEDGLD